MLSKFEIERVEGCARHTTFAFIQQQFSQHFGVELHDDTDELYAITDRSGVIQAAFGLNRNPASLFSRHYIGDATAVRDAALPQSDKPPRARIIELSHMCVRKPVVLCRLIEPLALFLWRQAEYLICTVTRELACFFQRKGLTSHRIADARIDQLPDNLRHGWGTYYAHKPTVLLGCLEEACQTLMSTERYSPEFRKSA